MVKDADSNAFTALLQVRLRYQQTKNLMADVLDAIDDYIATTVAYSKKRVQLLERVQVALVGFAGADEAVTMATGWSRGEDAAVVTAMAELSERFDRAAAAVLEVNDAAEARLTWIDGLASVLVREKTKWRRDILKAQSGSASSVGRLAGTNDDMIAALSRLDAGIGTFPEELDVWVTHCRDVLTPCLTELVRSFRVMSREETAETNKEVVRRLLAMQNEVEGTRFQALTKKGPGGRFDWPKLRSIMASPVLRMYYINYLQQAHNLENLLFLEEVKVFREKAAALAANSSKLLALATPIVEKYVVSNAPNQVNIVGSVREQTVAALKSNATVALFDEAQDHVYKMMDRDASIHFKQSPIGLDMVRRFSHCAMLQEPGKVLKPHPDVTLVIEPLVAAAPEDSPTSSADSIALPSSTASGGSSKRRLGSFTMRSKKSENDLKAEGRSSARTSRSDSGGIQASPKLAALLSPGRRRISLSSPKTPDVESPSPLSSSTGSVAAAAPVSSSPKPLVMAPLGSLEDALARSPRREAPSPPPSPPAISSPQSARRDRVKAVEDEAPLSPREWLRGSDSDGMSHSPAPSPSPSPAAAKSGSSPKRKPGEKMSPRSKLVSLRAAGTSPKNKQKIPQTETTK